MRNVTRSLGRAWRKAWRAARVRYRRSRALWRIRGDTLSGWKLVLASNLIYAARKLGGRPAAESWGRARRLRVRCSAPSGPVSVNLQHPSDLWICIEVFGERHYDVPWDVGPVDWLVDLGCNTGIATRYLLQRYDPDRVLAVEADPAIHRLAKNNLADLPEVITIQEVIGAGDAEASFYRNVGVTVTSSMVERNGAIEMRLETVTLDSLCARMGVERIDVLKFDIEGAEHDALPVSKMAQEAKLLVGEVHEWPGSESVRWFVERFPDHRWSVTQCGAGRYIVKGRRGSGASEETRRA